MPPQSRLLIHLIQCSEKLSHRFSSNVPENLINWLEKNNEKWVGEFQIDNAKFTVVFTNIRKSWNQLPDTSGWRVDFRRDNQKLFITTKNLRLLFNTIIIMIQEFLEKIKPQSLLLSPTTFKKEKLYLFLLTTLQHLYSSKYELKILDYGEFRLDKIIGG